MDQSRLSYCKQKQPTLEYYCILKIAESKILIDKIFRTRKKNYFARVHATQEELTIAFVSVKIQLGSNLREYPFHHSQALHERSQTSLERFVCLTFWPLIKWLFLLLHIQLLFL